MRSPAVRAAVAASLLAVPLLSACHRQPSFDERYASAQTELRTEAADIDSELAARDSEAAAADAVLGGATAEPSR